MKQLPNDTRAGRAYPAPLQQVAGWVSGLWRRWSLALQLRAGRCSVRRQKAGLLLLCGLSLGVSTLVLLNGDTAEGLPSPAPVRPSTPQPPSSGYLSPSVRKEDPRIGRLRRSLERLYTTESGRRLRDSLCRGRPGFLDTVEVLRHYYLPTLKTGTDESTNHGR